MHDYDMLAHGDHVLAAISGGVDSLALAWLLHRWRRKAPIDFTITCVHIDPGFKEGGTGAEVARVLAGVGIDLLVEATGFAASPAAAAGNLCYQCARHRRNRLFEIARQRRCNKLALGHHKDDLIETFFINILYAGNLSTMRPRQDLFGGRLAIIRPLSYLEKEEVRGMAAAAGLQPVKDACPAADHTRRDEIRKLCAGLFARDPGFKTSVFAALGNPRPDYLLTPAGTRDKISLRHGPKNCKSGQATSHTTTTKGRGTP